MKLKITEEEHGALSEALQEQYKQDGDNFVLQVEGLEDTGALKRAKDHEKEARKKAEQEAKELRENLKGLQDQLDGLKDADSRKKGDVEAIEKSLKDKMAKLEQEKAEEMTKLQKVLEKNTIDSTARALASELSGDAADIILPHIRSRLGFELEDGNAKVRVLDDAGNPTADSIDDLKNFFFTSDRFAPIVVGSKASGGGAAGAKGRGGATQKKLSEMNATEEALFARQNPEKYEQMLAAEETE